MSPNTVRLGLRPALLAAAFVAASFLPPPQLAAQTGPGEIAGHKVAVPGEKVEGTTAKLSEVEAELVAGMAPQGQAERLLQYAISHHGGATGGQARRGSQPSPAAPLARQPVRW